ncbi:TetR/AcrR family transcriptional regulator [Rhodococcus sp. IEGM 1381]|uniref:TetR/AcrR family transcriptional regulator n=1 Tax=Rhodococcus sp. IEGM 1381 TaxID=3047085 RepID=UPI0024B7FD95|nr:TetR/AcrR family transcriptional regulator [Rhodococcus sp. IEGM 1381]MDI9894149.1 TetR/AcrR family transcriptional regulator [Rhodococcus sp. IEGM 1381]
MTDTRKDAARNRARIVEAARELTDRGELLAFNAIARAADVGVGTVYRHFATVDGLEEAVVLRRFEELGDIFRNAGQDGLVQVLTAHFTLLTEDALFERVTARAVPALAETRAVRNDLLGQLEQLMNHAAAHGYLRADVNATTVLLLVCGLAHAARSAQVRADSPQGKALLGVILDGLRPVTT